MWSLHFMPNRWEKMETVMDYFLGLQITVDGDGSHEMKRCLFLGRKSMTNLDSTFEKKERERDIILPTMVCISQSHDFSSIQVMV